MSREEMIKRVAESMKVKEYNDNKLKPFTVKVKTDKGGYTIKYNARSEEEALANFKPGAVRKNVNYGWEKPTDETILGSEIVRETSQKVNEESMSDYLDKHPLAVARSYAAKHDRRLKLARAEKAGDERKVAAIKKENEFVERYEDALRAGDDAKADKIEADYTSFKLALDAFPKGSIMRRPISETATSEEAKAVAAEIARQLGGTGRLSMMIGAKNFAFGTEQRGSLTFKIMRGAKNKASWIKIILNGNDLYDIEYFTASGKKIEGGKDVYAEDLRNTLEQDTGLYMSLGTMGRKNEAVDGGFAKFKAELVAANGGGLSDDDIAQLWDERRREERKTPEQREYDEVERSRQKDGESVREDAMKSNQAVCQVKRGNEWVYAFCKGETGDLVTTKNRSKALGASALTRLKKDFANDEFRVEAKAPVRESLFVDPSKDRLFTANVLGLAKEYISRNVPKDRVVLPKAKAATLNAMELLIGQIDKGEEYSRATAEWLLDRAAKKGSELAKSLLSKSMNESESNESDYDAAKQMIVDYLDEEGKSVKDYASSKDFAEAMSADEIVGTYELWDTGDPTETELDTLFSAAEDLWNEANGVKEAYEPSEMENKVERESGIVPIRYSDMQNQTMYKVQKADGDGIKFFKASGMASDASLRSLMTAAGYGPERKYKVTNESSNESCVTLRESDFMRLV